MSFRYELKPPSNIEIERWSFRLKFCDDACRYRAICQCTRLLFIVRDNATPLFGQVIHGGCNDFTQWQSKYTNSRRYLTFFVLQNSLFRTIICGCGTIIHVHTRSTFDWIFPKLKLFLCVHSYVGRWFDFCSLFSFSEYKMTTRVSSLKTSGLMKKINKLIINTTYIFSKSTTHWCYMYNKVKKLNSLTRICLG